MAEPNLTSRLLILIGDGALPEVFGFPCGASTRQATFSKNTEDQALMDCDQPLDVPATVTRSGTSTDTELSIEGKVAKQYWSAWRQWNDATGADEVKNIRILLDEPAADGGGYWQLKALLTNFQIGATDSGNVTFSATIMGAGQRTWVDAT